MKVRFFIFFVLLPLIIIPLIIQLGARVAQDVFKSKATNVKPVYTFYIIGKEEAADLYAFLENDGSLNYESSSAKAQVTVNIHPDYVQDMEANKPARIQLQNIRSQAAEKKVREAIERYEQSVLNQRLGQLGVDMDYINPIDIQAEKVPVGKLIDASKQIAAFWMTTILVFFVLLAAYYTDRRIDSTSLWTWRHFLNQFFRMSVACFIAGIAMLSAFWLGTHVHFGIAAPEAVNLLTQYCKTNHVWPTFLGVLGLSLYTATFLITSKMHRGKISIYGYIFLIALLLLGLNMSATYEDIIGALFSGGSTYAIKDSLLNGYRKLHIVILIGAVFFIPFWIYLMNYQFIKKRNAKA